jgi:type IV secretory pathway VirJ component
MKSAQFRSTRQILTVLALGLLTGGGAAFAQDTLHVPPFGKVWIYHNTPTPAHVVLFASGDGGWALGVVNMAQALAKLDAAVVGFSVPSYLAEIQKEPGKCLYPAGDFENLSKTIQQHLGFKEYQTPVLVGYSSGATLVYCGLVQAPPTTFRGAISLGFCPDLPLSKPMCHGSGLTWKSGLSKNEIDFLPASTLQVPWIVLHGDVDQVCNQTEAQAYVKQVQNGRIVILPKVGHGFSVEKNWMPQVREAFRKVVTDTASASASPPTAAAPEVQGLSIIEVPPDTVGRTDLLAVHFTGDGGWGVTDNGVAHSLAAKGIGVAGVNSLKYFWTKKTPESSAQDLERIIAHYSVAWKARRVILIGYSFGADVMPFMINRLNPETRSRIAEVILISPGHQADFAFHVGSWIGTVGKNSLQVLPELEKLRGLKIICFYGTDDDDPLGPDLPSGLAKTIPLETGHRVGRGFEPIVKEIMTGAGL